MARVAGGRRARHAPRLGAPARRPAGPPGGAVGAAPPAADDPDERPDEVTAWRQEAQLRGGSTEGGRAVELPAHSGWCAGVRAGLGAAALERLAGELVELQVEQLGLRGTPTVAEEEGLARFLDRLRPAPLHGLSADRGWRLPGRVLEAVGSLPRLEAATLRADAGFALLARSASLSRLTVHLGDGVTDEQLAALSGARSLEALWLFDAATTFDTPLTGSFVDALPPGVRELDLSACWRADDATLERAARLPALRRLHLRRGLEGLTDAGPERLAGAALESLELGGPGLGDRGLRALSGLPLRALAVSAPRATRAGWEALPASLEELDVWVSAEEPRAWAAGLPGRPLRQVRLSGAALEEPRVDLGALFVVPGLSGLQLGELPVEPAALRDLGRHPGLRSVQLAGRAWTDRHVAALEAFPRLESVSLFLNEVTDRALQSLARCPALRRLELVPLRVSRGAVARLRRDRPDVSVDVLGDLQQDPPTGWLARLLGRFSSA